MAPLRSAQVHRATGVTVAQHLGILPTTIGAAQRFELVPELPPPAAPRRRTAQQVDDELRGKEALVQQGANDASVAAMTGLTRTQVKAWRGRRGIVGRRGRPKRTPAGAPAAVRSYPVPFWDWLLAPAEELIAMGVPPREVAALRRAHVGRTKPIPFRWLRTVGRWGGVQSLAEISAATGITITAVKNYANAHRLKYATSRTRTTHAQLAVRLYLDRGVAKEVSARRFGVLVVERQALCESLQQLLDDSRITIHELLRWPIDELESTWASHGFSIAPPRVDQRLVPAWLTAPCPRHEVVERLGSTKNIVKAFRDIHTGLIWRMPIGDEFELRDRDLAGALSMVVVRADEEDPYTGYKARFRAELPRPGPKRRRCKRALTHRVMEALDVATAYTDLELGAEDVLGIVLPETDREVFIPDLFHRIMHRLVLNDIAPQFSHPRHSFAHQRGKRTHHALGVARRLVRTGLPFAVRFDIRSFYPSTSVDLAVRCLLEKIPTIPNDQINIIRWLFAANIVRKPGRRDVRAGNVPAWEPSRHTLLPGAALAPLLAEIVAARVIHDDFDRVFGSRVHMLRWVDDGLILGNDPCAVIEALAFVEAKLNAAGYELHPTKTSRAAIDLRTDCMQFLGKQIGRDEIVTPLSRTAGLIEELRATPPHSDAHHSAALMFRRELALDPTHALRHAMALASQRAPAHAYMLGAVDAEWAPVRNALFKEIEALTA